MIKIGSTNLDTRILLAPLSGVSDLSFRLIAREHGAKFCFYEMADAHSLCYEKPRKTMAIFATTPEDSPIAAQILGTDPDMMLKASRKILDITKVSFLDVNAACPAKKVVKKGAGAYLLVNDRDLFAIIKKLSISLSVPVTVKIRVGYEKRDPEAIAKIARGCEANGASAIFVHGRTRAQGYAGGVDYDSIRIVKEAVKIPVFASGNIFNGAIAKKALESTGCDGILVARGALGNPWIFEEIAGYLKGEAAPQPVDIEIKKSVLIKHLSYIMEYKDLTPSGKVGYMRKFVMWYLKGVPGAKRIREKTCSAKTFDELIELINTMAAEKILVGDV